MQLSLLPCDQLLPFTVLSHPKSVKTIEIPNIHFYDKNRLKVLTFWCWTSWMCFFSLFCSLGFDVEFPSTLQVHTNTCKHTHTKNRVKAQRQIRVRFPASQSTRPPVDRIPRPHRPQQPPLDGLQLSQANWLGLAGGSEWERAQSTRQRRSKETLGRWIHSYLVLPQHNDGTQLHWDGNNYCWKSIEGIWGNIG